MDEGHSGNGAIDQKRSARCAFTLYLITYSNVSRVDYWHATGAFATDCDKGYEESLYTKSIGCSVSYLIETLNTGM